MSRAVGREELDIFFFPTVTSSVPNERIGERPRVVCADTVIEWLASNFASSSTTRM